MIHRFPARISRLLFAATTLLLLSACTQTKLVDNWQTTEPVSNKPDKVAVIAVLPEALLREAFEVDVARILQDKGSPAVPSSRIPGMSGGIRGEIDVEVATGLLRQADVDGVIVMFYSGGGNTEGYVRSDYWAEYLGSGLGYSWGRPYFTGYTDVYTVRKGPGWADFQTIAYVESSYYDMETEMPVWRIVTQTKDTEHADAAKEIANKIASEMRSAKLN
jgi:hypothetical protein